MEDVKTINKPLTIDITDFLDEGILKEKTFREKIDSIDWEQYRDHKVILKGCGHIPIPTWAYLMIATQLTAYAKRIFWGEPCSTIPIYVRSS
jgi:hypothetical protein